MRLAPPLSPERVTFERGGLIPIQFPERLGGLLSNLCVCETPRLSMDPLDRSARLVGSEE